MLDEIKSDMEAGDKLDSGTEKEPSENTFFLPSDMVGSLDCKPGDVIKLRVVGKDSDGDIEVEHLSEEPEGESDWKSDMRKTVNSPEPEGGYQNG